MLLFCIPGDNWHCCTFSREHIYSMVYFYCYEKCIKTCFLSKITTVFTLIKHQLHVSCVLTPVDLAMQQNAAQWCLIFNRKKNETATKMTAFVTRSILLFAAKALKYNKSYLWLLSLEQQEHTVYGALQNSIILESATHDKHSFQLLHLSVKRSILKLFIHIQ